MREKYSETSYEDLTKDEENFQAIEADQQPLLHNRRLSKADELLIDESVIPFRKIPSDENLLLNYTQRTSIFGFTTPLSCYWFFTVVGAEYCHIYFWLIKDLCWMQSWLFLSIFFGSAALSWSFVLLYHSLRTFNWHELWNFTALFLWLFANFWWMIGEAHDYEYPEAIPISYHHTDTSAVILTAALIWELFYYMIILPFNLLQTSKQAIAEYDDGHLQPRFPCFRNFRQYENLHMLFWIAKDLAWNRLRFEMWLFSVIPTILIAADLILITAKYTKQDPAVDITHFTSVLIWVIGNSLWAYGDFFVDDAPGTVVNPIIFTINSICRYARFYSGWILFVGMIPIFIMYGIWGTLTLTGRLSRFDKSRELMNASPHHHLSKDEESPRSNNFTTFTNTQLTGRTSSAVTTTAIGTTTVTMNQVTASHSGNGGTVTGTPMLKNNNSNSGEELHHQNHHHHHHLRTSPQVAGRKSRSHEDSIDVNDLIQ